MTRNLKPSLLLVGTFAFGYNLSALLHELGHALELGMIAVDFLAFPA